MDPYPVDPRKSSMGDVKAMDAVVMLLDGTEFQIPCLSGKHTTAEEMLALTANRIDLAPEHQTLFCIWVVSGSLSLPLKPHHQPFKVLRQWGDLLQAYSLSGEFEIPMIYLRRAPLVHQSIETKVNDPLVVKLLFLEMTFNVLYGLYPCLEDEAAQLAAVHLQLARGTLATKDDVLEVENCDIPMHLEKAIKPKAWAKKVLEHHSRLVLPQADKMALHQHYLEIGRKWPFYGATFFFGEIEAESRHLFREPRDEVVRVGVNIDGVHIINDEKNKLKLSLGYDQLMYNTYDDPAADDSCFLVEYDAVHKGRSETRRVVVWTKQAPIIDTLVTEFVTLTHDFHADIAARRHARIAGAAAAAEAGGMGKARGRLGLLERAGATMQRLRTIVRRDPASANQQGMFTLTGFSKQRPRGRVHHEYQEQQEGAADAEGVRRGEEGGAAAAGGGDE